MIHSELKSRLNEDICLVAEPDNHGHNYLFDCGFASKLEIGDVMKTRAVFVTHTHMDHFAYFDFILRHRASGRHPLTVVGPKGMAANVEGKFQAYTWNLIGRRPGFEVRELVSDEEMHIYRLRAPDFRRKKVDVRKLQNSQACFEFEGLQVWHCLLDHKIDSVAYRMAERDKIKVSRLPESPGPWVGELKQAFAQKDADRILNLPSGPKPAGELFDCLSIQKGFHLGYAMDHLGGGRNHELLRTFFHELDELWIESFFRHVDWDYARRHHHSTSYLSGLLANQAGVKKLHLVHHSRRYLGELEDLLEEGRAAYEGRQPRYQKNPVARYQDPGSSIPS